MKVTKGNPGHRPLNDAEPQPDVGEPALPHGMTSAARREWRKIVPLLMALGVLTVVDGAALEAYCESYSEAQQARKMIQKEGLTISVQAVTKDGTVVVTGIKTHPAVIIRDKAEKRMKSFLIEFGLTPASRSKVTVQKKPTHGENGNPLKAFLARRKDRSAEAVN